MHLRRMFLPVKVLAWTLVFALVAMSFNFGPVKVAEAAGGDSIDRLDKLLDEIDYAIHNLTTEEKQKLEEVNKAVYDDNTKTTQDLIKLLDQKGLKTKLEKLVNSDIKFEQAKFTLKLLIPLMKDDRAGLEDQIKELKQKYGAIINRLKNKGVTEKLLFDFIIQVDVKLSDIRYQINESNYEVQLVKTVQGLLKNTNDFKPIKDVLVNAHNRVPVLGSADELFNPDKAPKIVELINSHVGEISDLAVVKDTFYLAKEVFKDIYIPRSSSSSGGGGGLTSTAAEVTATVDVSKENKITVSGTNFTLVIPSGAFEIPAGAEAKVVVKELTTESAQKLFNDLIAGEQRDIYKRYGKVYDLELLIVKNGETTKATSFKKAVTVEFPYDDSVKDTNPEKLAVWKFNDIIKQVLIVGGKVDTEKRVVSVPLNSFSLYGVMVYDKTFNDLKQHWAKNDVEVLASRMIVKGITDKKFGPEVTVTRAEFAALLVRSLGLKDEAAISFKDVPAGAWFAKEVAKAVKAGIIKGYGKGKFEPNQKISREEMAVMIDRVLKDYSKVKTGADSGKGLEKFQDKAQVSSWAQDSVNKLLQAGVLQGRSDSLLLPKAVTTRAEAATIVKRLVGKF